MPHATKIATCCYCGTRAALVLRGKVRHELSCSGCGAPLHDLKQMPVAAPERRAKPKAYVPPRAGRDRPSQKPTRRKKSRLRKLFGEAVDLIEEIFD